MRNKIDEEYAGQIKWINKVSNMPYSKIHLVSRANKDFFYPKSSINESILDDLTKKALKSSLIISTFLLLSVLEFFGINAHYQIRKPLYDNNALDSANLLDEMNRLGPKNDVGSILGLSVLAQRRRIKTEPFNTLIRKNQLLKRNLLTPA